MGGCYEKRADRDGELENGEDWRKYMKKIIFILSVLLAGNVAQAKNLYVNTATGNDSATYASNTISNPWKTIGRAAWGSTVRSSPNSGQAAQAGDTVFVAAGTYNEGAASGDRFGVTLNPANSGTSDSNRIIFQAQGDVILRHTGSESAGTGGPIIGASSRNYITWDGFHIVEQYAQYRGDTGVITVSSSTGVTIKNNLIDGMTVTYQDNHNGIRLESTIGARIQNNTIHGIFGTGAYNNHNAAGIMTYDTSYATIENNEIYATQCGIWPKGDHSGDSYPQEYNTIRYNYIHNVLSEGIGIGDSTGDSIYQNIIANSRMGVAWSVGGAVNSAFYNNTIYNMSESPIMNGVDTSSGIVIKNNIISYPASTNNYGANWEIGTTPIAFDYNNYYNNASGWAFNSTVKSTLSSWRTATGGDAHAILTNPQFVNAANGDFHLQAGSPALTASDVGGPVGAYITGMEVIGISNSSQSPSLLPAYPVFRPMN